MKHKTPVNKVNHRTDNTFVVYGVPPALDVPNKRQRRAILAEAAIISQPRVEIYSLLESSATTTLLSSSPPPVPARRPFLLNFQVHSHG